MDRVKVRSSQWIRRELFGIYINPDEIEKEINDKGFLDFDAYQVTAAKQELLSFFKESSLLEKADCLDDAQLLQLNDNKLNFHE